MDPKESPSFAPSAPHGCQARPPCPPLEPGPVAESLSACAPHPPVGDTETNQKQGCCRCCRLWNEYIYKETNQNTLRFALLTMLPCPIGLILLGRLTFRQPVGTYLPLLNACCLDKCIRELKKALTHFCGTVWHLSLFHNIGLLHQLVILPSCSKPCLAPIPVQLALVVQPLPLP